MPDINDLFEIGDLVRFKEDRKDFLERNFHAEDREGVWLIVDCHGGGCRSSPSGMPFMWFYTLKKGSKQLGCGFYDIEKL